MPFKSRDGLGVRSEKDATKDLKTTYSCYSTNENTGQDAYRKAKGFNINKAYSLAFSPPDMKHGLRA